MAQSFLESLLNEINQQKWVPKGNKQERRPLFTNDNIAFFRVIGIEMEYAAVPSELGTQLLFRELNA